MRIFSIYLLFAFWHLLGAVETLFVFAHPIDLISFPISANGLRYTYSADIAHALPLVVMLYSSGRCVAQ